MKIVAEATPRTVSPCWDCQNNQPVMVIGLSHYDSVCFRLCWVGTFHVVCVMYRYIIYIFSFGAWPHFVWSPCFYAMPCDLHRYWMDWYERRKNLILGGFLGPGVEMLRDGDMWPEMVIRLAASHPFWGDPSWWPISMRTFLWDLPLIMTPGGLTCGDWFFGEVTDIFLER